MLEHYANALVGILQCLGHDSLMLKSFLVRKKWQMELLPVYFYYPKCYTKIIK